MSVIKEKNNDQALPGIAPPAVSSAPEIKDGSPVDQEGVPLAATQTQLLPPKASKGEKWYDWIVYRGINYWFNLASSIALTDYFLNLGGKPRLEKWSQNTAKLLHQFMPEEKALYKSRTWWKTTMICSGGWLLVVPIKLLEDRKRPIVHWLNKKLGVDQKAPDGHELAPEEIFIEKEQPTQSWLRVIGRRALGHLAVLGAGDLINFAFRDTSKPLPGKFDQTDPHGGKQQMTDFVMGGANRVLDSGYVPFGKTLATNPRTQAWMGFAVLDSVFTEITASVMWLTRGAKKKKMPQEIGDVKSAPANEDFAKRVKVNGQAKAETENDDKESFADKMKSTADSRKTITDTPRQAHSERIASESQPTLQAGV